MPGGVIERCSRLGSSGPGKMAIVGPVDSARPSPLISAVGVRAKITSGGTNPPSCVTSTTTSSAPVAYSYAAAGGHGRRRRGVVAGGATVESDDRVVVSHRQDASGSDGAGVGTRRSSRFTVVGR